MIQMPDLEKMYEYETYYHLTMDVSRLGKFMAHYEAFKMTQTVPGAIVECGVFRGTSLTRFAMFRELLGNRASAKIVGFDNFSDEYPDTAFEEDQAQRKFWMETAGSNSISTDQLGEIFERSEIHNYELVAGDVLETIPNYCNEHPELRISLLNVDIDFVESTQCALENFYDRVCTNGVILLDNYGGFHGDTKGIDDFFRGKNIEIKAFPFVERPCYLVKR